MGVSTQASFDATGFKAGVSQAQAALKTLDAALKTNEASFRAGGDAETYMQQKTQLLNDKMAAQKNLVAQLQAGLNRMKASGIDPLSAEYQNLEAKMLNAQTAMLETSTAISGLDESQQKAAGSASKLAQNVSSINRTVSLDQVIGGIDRITSGLENAAEMALRLGKNILGGVRGSAEGADEIATQAGILGMDIEEYQKYSKVFSTTAELTVSDWLKAKQRINSIIHSPTKEQTTILGALGISTRESGIAGKYGIVEGAAKDYEDLFWEIGETLRRKVESGQLSQGLAEDYANQIFGKGWANLNNIFGMGRSNFEKELENQTVVSEDTINKLAELNDAYVKLTGDFDSLKMEVTGGLAPALTDAAKVLDSLLGKLMDYLQSEKGQEALDKMGDAVAKMFEDLSNIDPDQAITTVTDVIDRLTNGVEWIADNYGKVETGLKVIAGAWGLLKVSEGALTALKIIAALKGISISGAAGGAAGGGLLQTAGSWIGGKLSGVTNWIGGALNGAAVGDWVTNNTTFGQTIRDGGGLLEAVRRQRDKIVTDITDNVNNFASDWQGVLNQILGRDLDTGGGGSHGFDVTVRPKPVEDAPELLAEQIGTITVPVTPVLSGAGYGGSTGITGGRTGGGAMNAIMDMYGTLLNHRTYANGLPFMPWDGLAYIHRGERIMTAEQNRTYTANSNLYVEHMHMNNGMEASALVAAMRAENRRISAGFGG